MLHILLTVLSVAGTILLALLGIAVFLILAVLFAPVFYRGHVEKRGETLKAGLKVSWMFRLVYVRVRYEGKKPKAEVFVFGIPVLRLKKYLAERKDKKKARSGPANSPTENPRYRQADARKRIILPLLICRRYIWNFRQRRKTQKTKKMIQQICAFLKKISGIPGKIKSVFKKFWFTVRNICAKIREWYGFLTSKTFKKAWEAVKTHGKIMLRHILPKKVSGYVRFGFDDPASTGQATGILGMFLPLIRRDFTSCRIFRSNAWRRMSLPKDGSYCLCSYGTDLRYTEINMYSVLLKNFSTRRHSYVREEQ